MLGDLLGTNENEAIGALRVTKRDCYLRALELDPLRSDAWQRIASCLTRLDESVKIRERDVTKVGCYVESLRLNPQQPRVLYELGAVLSAGSLSVELRGATHNGTDCLAEALKLSPADAVLWCDVARVMKVSDHVVIGERTYGKAECVFMSLKIEPKSATWVYLASCITSGSIVHNGQAYCTMDCYREAVVLDPSPVNWSRLGLAMSNKDRLTIGGKEFSQRACYKEALQRDPKCSDAWNYLASDDGLCEEAESVNDKKYSKLHCLIESAALNPGDSNAWASIGSPLSCTKRTGKRHRQRHCLHGC